jgi:hypothetical protein
MRSARPDSVLTALKKYAERVSPDLRGILETLHRRHAPEFVAAVREMIENRD